eukprot:3148768-Pyramimonas_sp.AAC.1
MEEVSSVNLVCSAGSCESRKCRHFWVPRLTRSARSARRASSFAPATYCRESGSRCAASRSSRSTR